MDYIKLIKSDAIKKYLYDIKFNINCKVAIYFVCNAENISIPVKHFIYSEIMENMSDDYHLYGMLKKFINFERVKYNEFIFGDSGKFSYEFNNGAILEKRYFDNYILLHNYILNNIDKAIYNDIIIRKTNDTHSLTAVLNKNLEIFEMDYLSEWDEEYNEIEEQFIEKIQVEIPMPFKIGDLVYIPNRLKDEPFKYNGLKYNTSFNTYTVYKLDDECEDLAEPEYLKLEYFCK